MVCKKCGALLTENTGFCKECGAPLTDETVSQPAGVGTGLVGWSTHYQDPEIIAAVKKKNKALTGYAWALVLVFPIGFLISGLFIKTMPLAGGLIIGLLLGLVMLGISMFYIRMRQNQIWEGVIIEKYQRENPKEKDSVEDSDHDANDVDIDYVLMVEKSNGSKHPIIYHNRSDLYDYFQIGDRVRYYAGLSTYEKYDKSKDRIIFCNVCSTENPISNERCQHCHNPLFK